MPLTLDISSLSLSLLFVLILGEYTLTLKKDGTDRIIKIFNTNGRYGFLKEGKCSSVVELINHFRTHSLIEYNAVLDICLLHPVSKFANEDELQSLADNKEALAHKYAEISNEIKNLTVVLEAACENCKRVENEIGFKRQAHEGEFLMANLMQLYLLLIFIIAFTEAETMFEEQIQIQLGYKTDAQPHEKSKLEENSDLLCQRLHALTDCKKNLERDLDNQRRNQQKLEYNVNEIKVEYAQLLRQEKRLKQIMLSANISESLIKRIADEGTQAWANQDSAEHMYEDSSWYFPNYTRNDAEKYLAGAPTGTFLIRHSAAQHAYALSIVANGLVNHCIIYHTENNTYGFAEPYNIYKTLKELVIHYSVNSLEEHNESLQTTLKIPYYIYAQSSSSSTLSSASGGSSRI